MAHDRFDTTHTQNANRTHTSSTMKILASQTLWKLACFSYGLFTWFLYLGIAVSKGSFFKKPTEKAQLQLKIGKSISSLAKYDRANTSTARDIFWNLSKQPLPGFYHAFFTLRNGLKLHYIHNQNEDSSATPNDLVIFIHGFPDSCISWRFLLKESAIPTSGATLVCVDLPGYGGSDSFGKYDTQVLEALTEFIVVMREKYTQSEDGRTDGNTFIIGHDWGCALTYRLACEAPDLADRFVATNGPLVGSCSKWDSY
jgi:hypothetical protein